MESETFFRPRKRERVRLERKKRDTARGVADVNVGASTSGGTSTTADQPSNLDAQQLTTLPNQNGDDIEGAGAGPDPVHQNNVISEDSEDDANESEADGFEEDDNMQGWYSDSMPVRVCQATP